MYLSLVDAFLKNIAESVTKENLPYLYHSCYIFPTKRAALYFKDFLLQKFPEENFILPKTVTIQEFIWEHSRSILKDDWHLIITLYQVQNELTQTHQPLEKFLPWGKLILKDFDECDKYLINAAELFSLLKAQKSIEDTFSISEEMRKYIEQFIRTTGSKDNPKSAIYQQEFIKTWSLLGEMYIAFQQKLSSSNFAYEGMAYREVYEGLKTGSLILPYQKLILCGFNALSVCEEEIFKLIEQHYESEFWWDADAHFMQNTLHEAGNFLRYYKKIFSGKKHHWLMDSLLNHDKHIEVTGISSDVGQTQYVAQQLTNEPQDHTTTAIILCDENLLTPLLQVVDAQDINITMGYPVVQSELYVYLQALLGFFCNARIQEKQKDYYHKDISHLIRHPYLKKEINEKDKLESILPFFVPYMPQDIVAGFLPTYFFQDAGETVDIINIILNIIDSLQVKDPYFSPVKECIMDGLLSLQNLLEENTITLDRKALPGFVKQFIAGAKVPFEKPTGEKHIQVMGFLETRIIDFDQLYILSLNDDHLPGTNKTNSFIPYNLRKGFGLPTFEQFDGINAYHFYRLLKRAKHIHLLYNNQLGDNSSEKSRFIRQLEHDLNTPQNHISEHIVILAEDTSEIDTPSSLIQIRKTAEMIASLRERKFSPSSLKIYIKCPVQFYLRYIAGIEEPEELKEDIDAAVFGLILHKVLELTYQPLLKKTLTAAEIKPLSQADTIRQRLKEAAEALQLPKEITQGSNKLQLKIIERIAQKIIENDSDTDSLYILHTEEKFIWDKLQLEDGTFATLQGTFDRIDKLQDGAVRIIDYKTGHIELPQFPDVQNQEATDTFIDLLFVFDKKDYSVAFQGLMYALMYYKLFDCREIYVGYHHAKKMKDGISYLNDAAPIPIELLLSFEKRLSQLISTIVYKDGFFTQSDNERSYRHSPYADLLGVD